MLTTGTEKFKSFLKFLEKQYKTLINIPNTTQSLDKKVTFSIYVAQYVMQGREMYLHTEGMTIPQQDIINFDNEIYKIADRVFMSIEETLKLYLKNSSKGNKADIDIEKIANLIENRKNMVCIAARWNTLRVMDVFDLSRERKKQKVPRRLPLLEEPCFCYDRVLETAMGIEHKDGFNPNRGVICMPPSSGKTYAANCYTCLGLMHFWLRFGETGIIRMTNNAGNAQTYGSQCVAMMSSYEWQLIFPEVKKYINGKGVLDIFKNNSAEKVLLKDCNPECNDSIFMFGAEAGINGKRSQLGAIMDDLSNGIDDMDNDELHKKLTDKVMSDVMDRSDDDNAPVIVQGTMYNQYDTQNSFIDNFEKKGMQQFKGRKFIRVTKSGKCFTCLVDIEDHKGNSIAPELYTNEKLTEKKGYFENRGKPYVYNLIYRQKRDSREPKTFDLQFLQLYNYSEKCKTLNKYAQTMIDTTRKSGNDFFAMPIFRLNEETGAYRLVDCIFEQKSLGMVEDPRNEFAQKICKKIEKDNIIECCIENNTSNTTGTLLKSMCKSFGYDVCKFRERYTAKRGINSTKIVRILNMEETIKNYIEFPNPETLPVGHPLRLFMQYLTNWSSLEGQKKTNPDDAPDSVAMFAEEFIFKKKRKGTIKQVGNLWF